MTTVRVQGTDGIVEAKLLGNPITIDNKSFVLLDIGVGAYVKGVFSRFVVVPTHLLVDRGIEKESQ